MRIIIIHHTGTKDSADITSNPSIIIIYQAVRIQLSFYVHGGGRDEGKKGQPVTGTDRVDKYRVTHYVGLARPKCRSLGLIALSK